VDAQRNDLLARLSALSASDALALLCDHAVTSLEVSATAVVLMSENETGSIAAAYGARLGTVQDLQFALGEGPCLTAFRSGLPVLDEDVGRSLERWPAFVPAAVEHGVAAVFALPLQIGAIRLGVLCLLRERAGPLSVAHLAGGYDLATIATVLTLDLQQGALGVPFPPDLDGGWSSRAVVHQATGMVAVQLGTGLGDALARIRAFAYAAERSIYDVASDVVVHRKRFDDLRGDP
jgi:GAF domain-containing protein